MKSITEILGGAYILLGLAFDLQVGFEEYLNSDHRTYPALLRLSKATPLFQVFENEGFGRRLRYKPFFTLKPLAEKMPNYRFFNKNIS
jgi:hypothetical protein